MTRVTKTLAIIGTAAAIGLGAVQPAAAEGGNKGYAYGAAAIIGTLGYLAGTHYGGHGKHGGAYYGGGHKKHDGYHGGHGHKKHGGYYGGHGYGHKKHGGQHGWHGHGYGHKKHGGYYGGYGYGHKKHGGYYGGYGHKKHGGYYRGGCTTVYKKDYWYGRYAKIGGTQRYNQYGRPYIVPGSRYVIHYY